MTLDDLLDSISVGEVDEYMNETNGGGLTALLGWFYVTDDDSVIAYFNTESSALRHRLTLINDCLNRKED